VNGIADMFGQWDTDGSGGVELGEFRQLWAQLKLGDMLRAAAAGLPQEPAKPQDSPSALPAKVTSRGTITQQGSLGLELAETIDGASQLSTIHIQKILPGSLAAASIPGLQVGMLLVTVDKGPVDGAPYDQVLAKLGTRPVELGFAMSPYKLPESLTNTMGVAMAASKWRTRAKTTSLEQTAQQVQAKPSPKVRQSASQPEMRVSSRTKVENVHAGASAASIAAYKQAAAADSWAQPEPEPEPEPEQPILSLQETQDRDHLKQAAFDYFKGDDEMLSEVELTRLLDAADYAADGSYIEQALEIFGKFDDDGSSAIDFPEFSQLWDYLQLDDRMKQSGMEDIILGQSHLPQTAAALFNKYDTNGDGVLDKDEVRAMMDDVGYEADEDYIDGMVDVFGKFDKDGGGSIGMSEFPALWKHLAPDRSLQDHTMDTAGMDADQMFLCLQKFFRKFDPVRPKERLWESVTLYNTPQKFQHLCNQLYGKYGEHPVAVWKGPEQMRPRDRICEKHMRAFDSHIKRGDSALRDAEALLRSSTVDEQSVRVQAHAGTQYVGSGLNSVQRSQHRVTVKFEDSDQQVGLNLKPKWVDGVRVLRVESIRPRSMAARVREVTAGLTVELIDGTKVDNIRKEIIDWDERAGGMLMRRPVTVVFGAGGETEDSSTAAHVSTALKKKLLLGSGGDDSDEETAVAQEERLVRSRNQVRLARKLGAVSLMQYDLVRGDEHFLDQVDRVLKKPTVEATFDVPGNLGIIFTAKDANSVPVIASIERHSLAAEKPQLEVGLELTAMQGQPIDGKTFNEVIGDLKAAECPLTLQFKHAISIENPRERRLLKHRPYREPEPWSVKPSAGGAGVVVRSLPSQVASALGRAKPNQIVQVVGREGDWMQIEWAGARKTRQKWEAKASSEGDEDRGWVQLEDRRSGVVFLEKASGASYFNLGQDSRSNVQEQSLSPEQLEAVLSEMRAAVERDDDAAMTTVLQAYAEAAKTDGRLDRAWQELRAVRSARRAEAKQEQQVRALQQHQKRLHESGLAAEQAGRRAQQAWREQSWAERERAVANRMLD
jgi:hypothetical protein